MRIALLTYSTKPRGGVVHTLALAEALNRAGQDVTVWTLARGGDEGFFRPVEAGVRIRAVPFPEVADESVGARVLRSIELLTAGFDAETAAGAEYDVIHAQDCITANAVPGRVRTVHHLDHFTTPELVACHRRALLEPVAHVCVSASVAAELERDWQRTAVVIANGVEADRFAAAASDDPQALARRAGWRQRFGDYVLAVGGIEPRKGTYDLVTAMARVRAVRPGTRLVIAGGDTLFDYRDYRAEVEALAERLNVEPELLGPVPHEELPGLVAAAGAFAFPSLQEGFGLAAMEALAAGVPVVTRDLPVFREVFGSTNGAYGPNGANSTDGANSTNGTGANGTGANGSGAKAAAVRFAAEGIRPDQPTADSLAGQLLAALEEPPGAGIGAEPGRQLAGRHSWDDAAHAHLRLYTELIARGVPIGS